MRILVLIHEYPPIGGGGGRAAQLLARHLTRLGHTVEVVTSHYQGLPRKNQESPGLQVVRLAVGRREPYRADFLSMLRYVLASTLWAWRRIRSRPVEVIHAHFAVPAGAAAWAVHRLTGIPYVLTVHLGDVPGGVPEKTDRWFRWLYPFTPRIWKEAVRVVAVSRHTQTLARRAYPGVTVEVIPNGIDVKALAPPQVRLHTPRHIVFAGRLVSQKGPLTLIRVLHRIRDLPWQATLLGDGPLYPQVAREVERLGLSTRIRLPGWVPPEAVLNAFDEADVLFMPSRQEGLPVAGLQALAKGLALVVSRVGGFPDLVREGVNGYLLAPDDEPGFAHRLAELLTDARRLLAFRQASLRLARNFDIRRVAQAYDRLLREACSL